MFLFIIKNERWSRAYVSFKAVTAFNSSFDIIKESKLPTLSPTWNYEGTKSLLFNMIIDFKLIGVTEFTRLLLWNMIINYISKIK